MPRKVTVLEALSLVRGWYLTECQPDCTRNECLTMATRNFNAVLNNGEVFSLDDGELTYKPEVGFIVTPYDLTGYPDYCDAFLARAQTQVRCHG
jgi:hypothetical protein